MIVYSEPWDRFRLVLQLHGPQRIVRAPSSLSFQYANIVLTVVVLFLLLSRCKGWNHIVDEPLLTCTLQSHAKLWYSVGFRPRLAICTLLGHRYEGWRSCCRYQRICRPQAALYSRRHLLWCMPRRDGRSDTTNSGIQGLEHGQVYGHRRLNCCD